MLCNTCSSSYFYVYESFWYCLFNSRSVHYTLINHLKVSKEQLRTFFLTTGTEHIAVFCFSMSTHITRARGMKMRRLTHPGKGRTSYPLKCMFNTITVVKHENPTSTIDIMKYKPEIQMST